MTSKAIKQDFPTKPGNNQCRLLLFFLLFLFHPGKSDGMVEDTAFKPEQNRPCLLITDQSQNRIALVDIKSSDIIWQWRAGITNIRSQDTGWFKAPSDAKAVYDDKYILMTASLGGVALIRIADKKTVFYTYVGGNTHSAELLPDGNIVTASSTGNYLTIIHTDSTYFPDSIYTKKIYFPDAHNVVWDKKRQLLWSAAKNKLHAFKYNFNCLHPDLKPVDSILLPATDAHDLFPVYEKDILWLTTVKQLFKIDLADHSVTKITGKFVENIKSVSSGPTGKDYPTIMMLPKEKWWTDEVLNRNGIPIFQQKGLRMYKARWFLPNYFSYPSPNQFKVCQQ